MKAIGQENSEMVLDKKGRAILWLAVKNPAGLVAGVQEQAGGQTSDHSDVAIP